MNVSNAGIDMLGNAKLLAATYRDNGTRPGSRHTDQISVALKASPFRRMLARMKRREDEPYHL